MAKRNVSTGGRRGRVRARLSPSALRRLPIETLSAAVDRRAAQGDKATAVRTARAMISAIPASGKAHRLLIRSLLTPPFTADDVREALPAAEVMLSLYEDGAVRQLYVDVLIAAEVVELDIDVASAVTAFALSRPESRLPAVRRFLVHLVSDGKAAAASDIAFDLATSVRLVGYWSAAHDFALRADRANLAEKIESLAADDDRFSIDSLAILVAARRAHHQAFGDVSAELEALRPVRSSAYSREYIRALNATGRQAEILEYLDNTAHSLPKRDEALNRCEAFFVLGRIDEAREILEDDSLLPRTDIEVFRLLRDIEREVGDLKAADEILLGVVRDMETRAGSRVGAMETPIRLYFELDKLEEIERIVASPSRGWQVGPIGRYIVALTHYCRRRFAEAQAQLDTLQGTIRHWEGEKLRARIFFELGDDEAALANRARFHRPDGALDEVVYHTLLHSGDLAAAFGMYLADSDRARLERAFGQRAEVDGDFPHVGSRAIIVQGGPGDEVQLAASYPALLERSDHTVIVGDPRLTNLMRRSFPDVEFIAAERMRSRRHAGFLAPENLPRATGELYDVLTEEAAERLESVDRVVFGRTLELCSLLRTEATPRYLLPKPSSPPLLAEGERPRVGLTWRSEFNSSMRSIHYATLSELNKLLALDVDIVCLQHDVSTSERHELDLRSRNPVAYVDNVDLRNDFDRTAALLTECDVVVGPGTTMTELAGAVGRPTVLLQPTRFGAWRGKTDFGPDYWQESTRVAAVEDPRRRAQLGDVAAAIVTQAVGLR